jgi:hypothetical protein
MPRPFAMNAGGELASRRSLLLRAHESSAALDPCPSGKGGPRACTGPKTRAPPTGDSNVIRGGLGPCEGVRAGYMEVQTSPMGVQTTHVGI